MRGTDDLHTYVSTEYATGNFTGWSHVDRADDRQPSTAAITGVQGPGYAGPVFIRDIGNQIRMKGDPTDTSYWQALPNLAIGAASAPTAITDSQGFTYVFVEGSDRAGWFTTNRPGPGFSAWQSLGGVIRGFSTSSASSENGL